VSEDVGYIPEGHTGVRVDMGSPEGERNSGHCMARCGHLPTPHTVVKP